MKKIITYIILAALLVVFIIRSDYDFSVILNADPFDVLMLTIVIVFSYISTFFAVDIQLKMLEVKEKKSNVAFISLATNLLNYLPAKGGMISLGTFLKVKKKVPVNRFVFVTILIYIFVTIVTVLISFVFIFDRRMMDLYGRLNLFYLLIFIAVSFTVLILSILIALKNRDNIISKYYLLFLRNRSLIGTNKLNIFYMVLIILAGITLFSMRMYFAFRIAGFPVSSYDAFLIGVIANLSFFLSFTPGGLGIKEGFVGGISFLLFGNAGVGIVASLADRAVNLILTIITGTYAIRHLDSTYFSKNEVSE
ncbi:MAG: lysylphosphatidylglycerol synthase domain-containing protein, partial [Candidatus Delongbacteria bacterium]|nr:lysylphosphatidylglycerol synthase domain-containing protein [Candidatus Delongbacteria bacterium]